MVTDCGCCFEEEEEVFDPGFETTEIIGELAIWKPTVTDDGIISWTKNASETPPESQNIRGPQGIQGPTGATGSPGTPGTDGEDGVGIASITFKQTTDAGNVYTVTLTDGTTYDFIAPKGAQGETGATGPAGADGQDGSDGAPGQDGITPTIGENGNWYLGSTDTGKPSRGEQGIQGVQGIPGTPGADGEDGNGISSAVLNADYTLTLNFTDGTHYTTGSIRGAQGAQGSPGQNGSDGADGVTFTPSVDESGVISWTNNGGLPNPESRSIKGPAGSDASVTEENIQAALGYAPVSPTQLSAKQDKLTIKAVMDAVATVNTQYILGVQSAVSIVMPTTAVVGDVIIVIFSSGATAATLTCDLTGFDFVPKANKTNKITFELIHNADISVTGDVDVWSVEIKEG